MNITIGIKAREVIYFTQHYPCAETRNYLLDKLLSSDLSFSEFNEIRKNKCFGQDGALYDSEIEAINSHEPYCKIMGFDIIKKENTRGEL